MSDRLLVLVLLGLFFVPELGAQDLRIAAISTQSNHDLLGRPFGASMSAGFRVHSRIGVRLGFEASADRFSGFGSTCVGLIEPGREADCAAENRNEEAALNAVVVTVPITLVSTERIAVELIPGIRHAWLESDQTGVVSDRTRSANKAMYGLGLGAGVQLRPFATRRLRMFLSAHRARLYRYENGIIVDGYSPFEMDISLTQAEVGVSVHR